MVSISEDGAPHAAPMLMKKTAINTNALNLMFSPSLLKSNYRSKGRWLEQQAKKDLIKYHNPGETKIAISSIFLFDRVPSRTPKFGARFFI
jgi:hypothetical protein